MKNNTKEEIDIVGLLKTIWDSKSIIIATTSIFSIVAVIYSLSLTKIYESKANNETSNWFMEPCFSFLTLAKYDEIIYFS